MSRIRDSPECCVENRDSRDSVDTPKYGLVERMSVHLLHAASSTARGLTKCVAVANFCAPASHQVHFVRGIGGHLGIPPANQLHILIDLVRLDFMEDNGMNILSPREFFRVRTFNVAVHVAALFCAIDELGEGAL